MKKSNVLVTGGAGFIGSELVRQLSEQAFIITIVDNLANGCRENVEDILCDNVHLVVADIRDTDTMTSIIAEMDIIFHMAALGVRHSIHSPQENHDVNATATLNILEIARKKDVKKFVYVSSSEVYGTARFVPMTEEHPTYPMTVYGAGKLAGDCYTRAYFETYQYPTVVVRPFNAYGPKCHHEGDSGEVIPKFLIRCLAEQPMIIFGDGTQTRDFTYVSDVARGIILAGLSDDAVGKTINLGSGKEISIKNLADEVKKAADLPNAVTVYDLPRPGDVLRLYADIKKATHLLGYQPSVSLSEGLQRLKAWYINSGKTPHELLETEVVHNWNVGGDH